MDTIESVLAQEFPFWNNISDEDKALLRTNTVNLTYKKGQNIHSGASVCTGSIIVKTGCLRVYMLSSEGREITLYRLYPGEICMLSASCVYQDSMFDITVDADEDSEVYIVGGAAFKAVSEHSVEAENMALKIAVNRFSQVMWVLNQVLFKSFDKRLAMYLRDECKRTASSEIKTTHELIAGNLGSAREVVSRMLGYFSSEGIVKLRRGVIYVVDFEKLERLIEQ